MNINKLIEAAKRIDKLARIQERRTKEWQRLAKDAKDLTIPRKEIERRRSQLDSIEVIDFGDAIEELREALGSK